MIQPDDCEILYHFFRTGSEYIRGYRSDAPYPESYAVAAGGVSTAVQEGGRNVPPAVGISGRDVVSGSFVPSSADGRSGLSRTFGSEARCSGCATAEAIAQSALSDGDVLGSLQAVYAAVAQCGACKLAATRTKPVAGEGPEELSRLSNSVEVMVIGEGPGADEDRQGRPFVGKAGQLLDKMLEAIQLSRKTNCYITNVVKCRPPQNRDPEPDERSCCAPFLEAQIRLTRPKMILVLGRVAAQHLLQTSEGIGKLRGRFFEYSGIPLMPTYHPSALLRDESLKRPAWEDLKRFRSRLLTLQGQG